MFRIAREMVQVSSPAHIPLMAVRLAEKPPPAPTTPAPQQQPKAPPQDAAAAQDLLQKARRQAENAVAQAEEQAASRLNAAAQQAKTIVENAQEQAQAKLTAATKEEQKTLEEARLRGRQQGWAEGLALHRQQMKEASQQLSQLLAELAKARETFFETFEDDMVDLALDIAKKITLTAVNKDEAVFKAMIENAIKHLRREGKISLYVSEQQYNDFFKAESANFVLAGEPIRVEIIQDTLLENGDLIVESEEESVNAGVSSQLKHIALAFGRPEAHE